MKTFSKHLVIFIPLWVCHNFPVPFFFCHTKKNYSFYFLHSSEWKVTIAYLALPGIQCYSSMNFKCIQCTVHCTFIFSTLSLSIICYRHCLCRYEPHFINLRHFSGSTRFLLSLLAMGTWLTEIWLCPIWSQLEHEKALHKKASCSCTLEFARDPLSFCIWISEWMKSYVLGPASLIY